MISKKSINALLASAILLLGVIIVLAMLAPRKEGVHIFLYSLIVVDVALAITGGYLKRKRQSIERGTAKSARASVLKHIWEEKQRREW